jgi:4-amino-4-deoxy-L-arabinose transferase-like glycosyltransferase/sugar lactone lactonase YvrE
VVERYRPISFFCGSAALIIGIAGQILLRAGNFVILACFFYLLAVGLFIFAFQRQPGPDKWPFIKPDGPPYNRGKWSDWEYITGGFSVVTAVLAFWLFSTSIPPIIPWLLHLFSIVLLIFSIIWCERGKLRIRAAFHNCPWFEIGLLLAIIGIGAFMRLYRFDQIPFGTWYDEADEGLIALKILNTPGFLPVFDEISRLPTHFLYLIALAFRIFGVSTLSIRAVSVVFGLLTIIAAYLAGREFFDRRTGLVLAFLFAVSRWDINFSRIGLHGISVPFFELLTMALILRAMRQQRLIFYMLAGLSLGFGLCFYVPFRLFPLVVGLFLLVSWLSRHDLVKLTWRGLLLLGLGFFIACVPIAQFALNQPDAFFGRMEQTSIFNGKTTQEGWKAVAETAREHLLMFNYQGDQNGRHNLPGEPMLDPISGSFLILGAGLSLWRIRQPKSVILLIWLLLMLVPGIFSLDFESPHSLRTIGSMPAAFLLAVVPIHSLWLEWDKSPWKRRAFIFVIPLTIILAAMGYINYHIYFDRQAKSFDSWNVFSTPETITGKLMAELGNQVDYYISTFFYQTPTIKFLAPNVTDYHRLETHDTLPLRLDGKKGVVIIVDADRKPFYLQAMSYYPNGNFKEYQGPNGNVILYQIYLKPADILAAQGLTASYYQNANWLDKPFLVRAETNLNFDWKDGDPATFPYGVEWQGILFAHEYGNYKFVLRSPGLTEMFIDGIQIPFKGEGEQSVQIELAQGNHTFKLRSQAKQGHFELAWQPPNEELTTIPPSALLLPPITNNGLLGSYYANDSWQPPAAFTRIDPWIHFYYHNPPLPRPYTVEWQGWIQITKGGHYHFGLESIDESSLSIGGQLIVDDQVPNQYQDSVLDLSPGLYPIRIRFSDRTGSTHINVYWTPPDSIQEIIPQAVLFPPQGGELLQNITSGEITTPSLPTQTTKPVETSAVPDIQAKLLWQTGTCGSGTGQFKSPHGITADRSGNIWIADTGNHRMVELDKDGNYLQTFGKAGEGDTQFIQPVDVVVEQDGSLLVLDSEAKNPLKRFTPSGKFLGAFGLNLATYFPRGLGIDSSGSIYIADTGGNRLVRLTADGNVEKQWVMGIDNQTPGQPVSVTAAGDGTVYVLDGVNSRVLKILANGDIQQWPAVSSGDSANGPRMQIGQSDLVFITDPEGKRVVIFTLDGQPAGQIRSADNNRELFSKPVGIAVRPDGVLVVSDTALCRVMAFQLPDNLVK